MRTIFVRNSKQTLVSTYFICFSIPNKIYFKRKYNQYKFQVNNINISVAIIYKHAVVCVKNSERK